MRQTSLHQIIHFIIIIHIFLTFYVHACTRGTVLLSNISIFHFVIIHTESPCNIHINGSGSPSYGLVWSTLSSIGLLNDEFFLNGVSNVFTCDTPCIKIK